MSRVLEQLIARGRRERNPSDQRDVAFRLAEMSSKTELHARMVLKGVVKALLVLIIQSSDSEALRLACLCLANVASSPSNRLHIVEEGALPPLVKFIQDDNDAVAKQYLALTIGNLAVEREHHPEIVRLGTIAPLVKLLDPEMVHSGVSSAFALTNLSVNSEYCSLIGKEGAIPRLVALACRKELSAQRQALACLRGMYISSSNRIVAIQEGVLDPLVLMARSTELDIQRQVAAAFGVLSSTLENKVEIFERAVLTIISLSLSGDPFVEENACRCLANLMELPELHDQFMLENGLATILALAMATDLTTRSQAYRCLAHLTANNKTHAALMNEDVLPSLVAALGLNHHHICQQYATIAVANLSSTGTYHVQIIKMGFIALLVALVQGSDRELDTRRYAALALANLAAIEANHSLLMEANCVFSLVSLAKTTDVRSQYHVAFALANFASNVRTHVKLIEENGLQLVITLASSEDTNVQYRALAALRGLGMRDSMKVKIVQEGGLEALVLRLQSNELEVRREASGGLYNVSLSKETKHAIAKSGAVVALLVHAQSQDMDLARQCCATLANLAEIEENQKMICTDGGFLPFIALMGSPFLEVQREAGRAVGNIAAFHFNHDEIIEHGGHQLFISYLMSSDMALQRMGALGLCNLATNVSTRVILMKSGALGPLLSLAKSEQVEIDTQQFAILASVNLATCVDNHRLIVEDGSLSLLISLSSVLNQEICQYAAFALVLVARNADFRTQITEQGGLEAVLYLARTQSSDLQVDIVTALCTLSFLDANKSGICKRGGLPVLLSALTTGDVSVQHQALCTLANLAEKDENQSHLVVNGIISPVMDALEHGDSIVQPEAARVLGNLSRNYDGSEAIWRQGAIRPLLELLNTKPVECQRMAAMALCNLSTNVKHQPELFAQGLMEPILARLETALDPQAVADTDVIRYCLLVVANVATSTHAPSLDKIVRILAAFATRQELPSRQFAIFALSNVCSKSENAEKIEAATCLPFIISSAFSGDTKVQYQAIAALRGLAVNPVVRDQIVRLGALETLMLAAFNGSGQVQRQVAATLASLSLSDENKVAMARAGCLSALLALAGSQDLDSKRQAVCSLANVAEMLEGPTQRSMLEEKVLPALSSVALCADVEVRRQVSRCLALFAANRSSQAALLGSNALSLIREFTQESEDPVCRRFGTLAIGNMAVDLQNHGELFNQNMVRVLLTAESTTDVETRRVLAFALNNLASNESSNVQLAEMGGLRMIVDLLHDPDMETHLQACSALGNTAVEATNRTQVVALGALPLLFTLVQSESVELQREVCRTLRNLSLSDDNKVAIVRHDGVAKLLTLVHSNDQNVAHQACGVLANVVKMTENHEHVIKQRVLQHLTFVLQRKHVKLERQALRTIANMSAADGFTAEIVSGGGLASLITALQASDASSQRYAAMGVANLSTKADNIAKIVQETHLPTLVALADGTRTEDLETRRFALSTLINLASERTLLTNLLDSGVLDVFIKLLKHVDRDDLQCCAAWGIANFSAFPEHHFTLVQVGDPFLHALVRLLESSSNIKCQYRVVCALRGLCVNEVARQELVRYGVLRPLLALIKSPEKDLVQEVLACLCNLSLSGCFRTHFEMLVAACEIPSLVAFLCSTETTYRRFGALTLSNLATKVAYQDEMIQAGAVSSLIEAAKSADVETHCCIAFALCNFAANPDHRQQIVAMGGLSPIIQLAHSEDVKDQKMALAALRGLSDRPQARLRIGAEGGVEALVHGARSSSDVEVKREIAMTVYNLSLSERNKLRIAASPLMSFLITLMLSHDEESAVAACASIANIAENQDTHSAIVEHHGLNVLLQIAAQDGAERLTREAVKCVANLASNQSLHDLLLADEWQALLVHALEHADLETRLFGVIGLENLVSKSHIRSKVLQEDAVLSLIKLTSEQEARRFALLALGCILTKEGTQKVVGKNGVLSNLLAALDVANDMETRFYAAFALCKVSNNENLHGVLGHLSDNGRLLIELARDAEEASHLSAQCHAVSVLRRIACFESNRVAMVAEHCELLTWTILACARHADLIENQREAVACLWTLSLTPDNVLRLTSASPALFDHLFALCSSSDVEVARHACGAAANYAANLCTHEYMKKVRAVYVGVKAMQSRHLLVYREASRLVANLLSTLEFHADFVHDNGLAVLLRIAMITDHDCQYHSALALHKLTRNVKTHEALLATGFVPTLHRLLKVPELDVQQQAAATIMSLTANSEHQATLAQDEGTIVALLSLLQGEDPMLQTMGAACVRHLALYAPIKTQFVHQGGLLPLFTCCAVQNDHLRLECARAMARLSEDSLNQVQMVRQGALPALLELSKADNDQEMARYISRAFANLSSHPDNHVGVFSIPTFHAVLKLTQSQEERCQRNAAMCLGNLAVTSHNQLQIAELGGLLPLSQLLQSECASTREAAARAFYRLCVHKETQQRIADMDAVPAFVALLGETEDHTTQCYAAMAICNLSTNARNEQKIMQLGGMQALVEMLRFPSVKGAQYAAMALCNLTIVPVNQRHLVARDDGLDLLIHLTGSSDREGSQYACMVLANVSAHRENRLLVVERHALLPLHTLCLSSNLACQRSAALALYNLSCAQANQLQMVETGIHSTLVDLAGAQDGDCQRAAIMTLGNLAANNATRLAVAKEGGLLALIRAAKEGSEPSARRVACIALCNLACDPLLQVQVLVHGGLAPLFALTDADVESQKVAIMALSNLATNMKNHNEMIRHGVVKVAGRLNQSNDDDLRLYAAFTVANLASNEANCAVIGDEGGIPALIMLTHAQDSHIQTVAVSALRRLCEFSAQNCERMVRGGGLFPLAIVGMSEEAETQVDVAATYHHLSCTVDYRTAIVEKGALRPLMKMTQASDLDVVKHACGALGNLSEQLDTHPSFVAEGWGNRFVALLMHPCEEIRREVSHAIANLLSSIDNQSELLAAGLHSLIQVGFSLDASCQYNVALALRKLALNAASHQRLVDEGGVEALFFLLHVNDLKTQRQSLLALRDLAVNSAFHWKYVEKGGIPALITFLRDGDASLQVVAIATLRHLTSVASHERIKEQVVQEGTLRLVLQALNTDSDVNGGRDLQVQCVGLTANLAEHSASQEEILTEGLIRALVAVAKIAQDSVEILQDISRTLANVCSNEANHSAVHEQGALLCLIELTESSDDIIQRYAAMGLRFLSTNAAIRVQILQDSLLQPFIKLAHSSRLDHQRAAATAFSSFSLNEENVLKLVQEGALPHILRSCGVEDLEVKRESVFALANVADSLQQQRHVVQEGAIFSMINVSTHNDTQVQRECARVFVSLSLTNSIQHELVHQGALPSLFRLTRSSDLDTQRLATLALANVASLNEDKALIVEPGVIRQLMHLLCFPDAQIQRYAALAFAGLSLGGVNEIKQSLSEEEVVPRLIDLLSYPNTDVQLCSCLALTTLVLGDQKMVKELVMQSNGVSSLLALLTSTNEACVCCALYCLGSLAESKDVLRKLVELGILAQMTALSTCKKIERLRNCGYLLALVVEQQTEFHDEVYRAGGLDAVIALAGVEDMECQDYASFSLVHLAWNRKYQVSLVKHGALQPLLAMLSARAVPRHYASLALLKLAENYENRLRIVEEGGIEALLRIARTRSINKEMQHKTSLTLAQLASTATRSVMAHTKVKSDSAVNGKRMAPISKSVAKDKKTLDENCLRGKKEG